ncbi:MAG: outer membrane protein transport protein, partial [Candidatus Tectomicrobia bacterium]|nr:outer membrane protein transport protein [Candidatus Tectomicrobia bacterium]
MMRHSLPATIVVYAMMGLLGVMPMTVSAAGFAILEQSVKGLGGAFAGGAAIAEDASTVFFNPAGLTRLRGVQTEAALHIIIPSFRFKNQGSALNGALTGGVPMPGTLSGGNGGDAGEVGAVPNVYYAHQLTDRLHVGLGVNVPFGLSNEYRDGWVGRYHALRSELSAINVNPSLAFKATSFLSIGAGLNIQYVKARLTSAIDQSALCLGLAARGRVPSTLCASAGLVTPGNVATDAEIDLDDATDISLGYNVGVLFTPTSSMRFGVHFRSAIRHELEGDAKFDRVNTTLSNTTGLLVDQG